MSVMDNQSCTSDDWCNTNNNDILENYFNNCLSNDNSSSEENRTNMTFEIFENNVRNLCSNLYTDRMIAIVAPIIMTIIVLVGTIGNILVLIVVALKQQMRNTTNILIANLAISDLLFVLICVPPVSMQYMQAQAGYAWAFDDIGCRVVQYLVHVTCYCSVITLVLLSLDRYLAVVYPVQSISWRTVCNAWIGIGLTWLVTLTLCIPLLFAHSARNLDEKGYENITICSFQRTEYNEYVFQTIFFATSMVIPLLCMIWLYINMLNRLWKGTAANNGPGPLRDRNAHRGEHNKKRVTRLIIIVIVVFTLCWLPYNLVLLLKAFHIFSIESGSANLVFQVIANCLAYCNSCLNPILYAFFSPNFRSAFVSIISCGKSQSVPNLNTTNLNGEKTGGAADPVTTAAHKMVMETNDRKISLKQTSNDEDFEMQPLVNGQASANEPERIESLRTEMSRDSTFEEPTTTSDNGHVIKATLH